MREQYKYRTFTICVETEPFQFADPARRAPSGLTYTASITLYASGESEPYMPAALLSDRTQSFFVSETAALDAGRSFGEKLIDELRAT